MSSSASAAPRIVAQPAEREVAPRTPGAESARVAAYVAAALLAAQLGLRVVLTLRMGFDTDEPQHLHVAWAWTRGLVPYRDVFDNHAPLFHAVIAPLVTAFGERPELLFAARFAMIPLAAAALAATYAIGRALFSPRVGAWAAILVGLMPAYLFTSLQFRADDLWACLWLAALAIAVGGVPTRARGFAVGTVIGLAFATSMKTSLLLATFAAAYALAIPLERPAGDPRRRTAAGAAALAIIVVLAIVAAIFARLSALPDLLEYVVFHNVAAAALWRDRLARSAMFIATLPLVILAPGWDIVRSERRPLAARGVATAALLYTTTLNGFWPIVTRQDCLPLYPVLAVFLVAAIARLAKRADLVVFTAIGVVEIALCLHVAAPWKARTRFEIGLVGDVLRLTRPGDPVMDLKGETLFRERPFFYVFENIAEQRFARGEIRDDVAERLIATHTHVSVVDNSRFPPVARQFLLDNYLPVGHLRVAGKLLAPSADGSYAFTVCVPGRYMILSPAAHVTGTLDGEPLEPSRVLGRGPHVFRPNVAVDRLALVWADAAERGFSPFHPGEPS
jgi:Dolichyl-phosphate-mannose-protein mannosyltransferase